MAVQIKHNGARDCQRRIAVRGGVVAVEDERRAVRRIERRLKLFPADDGKLGAYRHVAVGHREGRDAVRGREDVILSVVPVDAQPVALRHDAGVGESDGLPRAAIEIGSRAVRVSQHAVANGRDAAHVVVRLHAHDADIRTERDRVRIARAVDVVGLLQLSATAHVRRAAVHGAGEVVVVGKDGVRKRFSHDGTPVIRCLDGTSESEAILDR